MHERVKINSCSGTNAVLSDYTYQVRDTSGNPKGWWPCDTTFADLFTGPNAPNKLMEYSILTKNKAVGINENKKEIQSVLVFPNPARDNQTLIIESARESVCVVELHALMGRLIKTIYNGKVSVGQTSIEHNIAGLSNSMYIYVIKLGDQVLNKKFVKD